MKILTACALAPLLLSGCIAVPVVPAPAPALAAYHYGPPAATVQFGYTYRDGGHRRGRGYRR